MRRLAIAAAIALLAGPAYAQFSMGGGNASGGARTRYTDEEKRNEQATEKAYRDAVKNTRGENSEGYDPWRNIRTAPPEKKPQR